MLILWHFFFNDRDFSLFELEYFGKGIKQYSGKVVWIVGASTDLGQSIALELASVGAKIVLSARRTHILQKLKADCAENSKGKLSESNILVLPLSITEMNEEYVQTVIEHFGEIDVFIVNTSHIELGEACNSSIGMDKAIFDVNFFGNIFLVKKVVNHFKETNGGQIIVVSSISGKFGIPGQAAASATKQALNITPEEQLKMTQKGLKTKRCAHLVLIAGANRCTECWVSNQPFLFLIYLAQYSPWIHRIIMSYIFSDERLEKIYDGKSPNIWMWKPLIVI
ncbi:hypothetical protein JTE90_002242 [Oedothorax gibbosus]|uniref:Dehydrogenase/reductase SDR family member 7 n=1 Tax=Oedothorax gibbosus TaxID=931172 RepID=A0AAV6V8N7_9ARAC|nr:hypothetical protein JTE90_002242 [Oedothorax gibbosus]